MESDGYISRIALGRELALSAAGTIGSLALSGVMIYVAARSGVWFEQLGYSVAANAPVIPAAFFVAHGSVELIEWQLQEAGYAG